MTSKVGVRFLQLYGCHIILHMHQVMPVEYVRNSLYINGQSTQNSSPFLSKFVTHSIYRTRKHYHLDTTWQLLSLFHVLIAQASALPLSTLLNVLCYRGQCQQTLHPYIKLVNDKGMIQYRSLWS